MKVAMIAGAAVEANTVAQVGAAALMVPADLVKEAHVAEETGTIESAKVVNTIRKASSCQLCASLLSPSSSSRRCSHANAMSIQ